MRLNHVISIHDRRTNTFITPDGRTGKISPMQTNPCGLVRGVNPVPMSNCGVTPPPQAQYPVIASVTVTTTFPGSTISYDGSTGATTYIGGTFNTIAGPIYQTSGAVTRCPPGILGAYLSATVSMARSIAANAPKYSAQVGIAAGARLAGTLGAEEFIGVLIAVLGPAEFLAIAGVALLSIGPHCCRGLLQF